MSDSLHRSYVHAMVKQGWRQRDCSVKQRSQQKRASHKERLLNREDSEDHSSPSSSSAPMRARVTPVFLESWMLNSSPG